MSSKIIRNSKLPNFYEPSTLTRNSNSHEKSQNQNTVSEIVLELIPIL
jgi:hypothetical protein